MSRLNAIWYRPHHPFSYLLLPLTLIYCALATLRRLAYRSGVLKSYQLSVPLIVVGNLTVGGTGKTPLVIRLVEELRKAGYTPGVISRGYGGESHTWPQLVTEHSDPVAVGDEPVLIVKRTRAPMAVGPDRVATGRHLLEHAQCDVIIADDGLQHLRLQRDIELLVVDGERRFGNGRCLPSGPLRERLGRLGEVDFVVANGAALPGEWSMRLLPGPLRRANDGTLCGELSELQGKRLHAVAGIGNPQRFFARLAEEGIEVIPHAFGDHHRFVATDLEFDDDAPVLMTEKDAVKCARFARGQDWYVPVDAQLDEAFIRALLNRLEVIYGQKTA